MPKIATLGVSVSYGPLPRESSDRVKMADCDCQGIGGVQWLRRNGKVEQVRDHVLDLMLLGSAVADN